MNLLRNKMGQKLIAIGKRVFERIEAKDTYLCKECAALGNLPLCRKLPDCKKTFCFRQLSSREVRQAKRDGIVILKKK